MSDDSVGVPAPKRRKVKIICGHWIEAAISEDNETAYCPICKRDLFTGWPEHMEQKAKKAREIKAVIVKYLDACESTGVEPRLAAIVGAAESIVESFTFNCGYVAGGAIAD